MQGITYNCFDFPFPSSICLYLDIYFNVHTYLIKSMCTHTQSCVEPWFTNSGIVSTLVTLLFCNSAVCTIFMRTLLLVSCRQAYLLKRTITEKKGKRKVKWAYVDIEQYGSWIQIIPTFSLWQPLLNSFISLYFTLDLVK